MLINNWSMFWTAVGAVGQVAATILAIAALFYSMRTFNKSMLLSHFGALDETYADLLRIGVDKPYLRGPANARTPKQEQEYEYYAHLAWCFVENVYDRSLLDEAILHSWKSAIEIETRMHRAWLERPENAYMFKAEFRFYIAATFPHRESLERVNQ